MIEPPPPGSRPDRRSGRPRPARRRAAAPGRLLSPGSWPAPGGHRWRRRPRHARPVRWLGVRPAGPLRRHRGTDPAGARLPRHRRARPRHRPGVAGRRGRPSDLDGVDHQAGHHRRPAGAGPGRRGHHHRLDAQRLRARCWRPRPTARRPTCGRPTAARRRWSVTGPVFGMTGVHFPTNERLWGALKATADRLRRADVLCARSDGARRPRVHRRGDAHGRRGAAVGRVGRRPGPGTRCQGRLERREDPGRQESLGHQLGRASPAHRSGTWSRSCTSCRRAPRPPAAGSATALHVVSDLVATLFGAPTPVRIPDPGLLLPA